jgi:hypothetical protein
MNASLHARLMAGVLFLAGLSGGCAHRGQPVEGLEPGLPARTELADTPFHPQERYQCGPAALATVLNVQGVAITPEALVPQIYLPARKGSLQAEILAAVRRQGLLPVHVEPALGALLAEIQGGHPVMVLQNLGFDWLPRWHYAVAMGYDLERGELILRSGTERRYVIPFNVFMKTWDRSKRWGVVVLKPGEFPARPRASTYLEAASGLEASGRAGEARIAYQAASRKWPDNMVAWLGLGNTEYALGQYPAAEQAFRQAIALKPDTAPAWNNLAYALAGRQCMRAAQQAAHCATRLTPGNTEFADTLKEMQGLSITRDGSCAPLPVCPAN